VYSIAERNTFDSVHKWITDLRSQSSSDAEILLVGNKNDLEDMRKVTTKEAMEFAKKNGVSFLETSAKDGTNCTKAMQIILQDIHMKHREEKLESNKPNKALSPSKVITLEPEPKKSHTSKSSLKSSSSSKPSSGKSTPKSKEPVKRGSKPTGKQVKDDSPEESSAEEAPEEETEESSERGSKNCAC